MEVSEGHHRPNCRERETGGGGGVKRVDPLSLQTNEKTCHILWALLISLLKQNRKQKIDRMRVFRSSPKAIISTWLSLYFPHEKDLETNNISGGCREMKLVLSSTSLKLKKKNIFSVLSPSLSLNWQKIS